MSPYLISNWTRHIKVCKKLKTKPANYQQPLGKFLTARDTSSCLESDNTDTGQTSDLLFSPAAVGSLEGSSPLHLSGEENNIIAVQSLMSHPHETSKPQAESSQIFQEAPPSKAIVPIGGWAHCNGVIDCKSTQTILAKLVNTDKPAFSVRMASVLKQSGSSDCGLFAIAYVTHIANRLDCVFSIKLKCAIISYNVLNTNSLTLFQY